MKNPPQPVTVTVNCGAVRLYIEFEQQWVTVVQIMTSSTTYFVPLLKWTILKNLRRSRMTGRHVEDALRVCINSVNELEKIPAVKYAKYFIGEDHLRTDDPRYRKKQDFFIFSMYYIL